VAPELALARVLAKAPSAIVSPVAINISKHGAVADKGSGVVGVSLDFERANYSIHDVLKIHVKMKSVFELPKIACGRWPYFKEGIESGQEKSNSPMVKGRSSHVEDDGEG
jgi:hypothetical protein